MTWAGIVVWALSVSPSLAPFLPPGFTWEWADVYADVPILVLVFAALIPAVRTASGSRERAFWRLLAGTVGAFLGVRAVYAVVPVALWGTRVDLATDVLYLSGYLCVALAMERRPDLDPGAGPEGRLRQVETLGMLLFGFGLLTYFVLIPSVFNPEVYASWVSSLLLYAVLDVYLIVRCAGILRSVRSRAWARPFGWLLAVFVLWLAGDLVEGLIYMEALPWVDPGTPADLLWMAPTLLLFLAVRSRAVGPRAGARAGGEEGSPAAAGERSRSSGGPARLGELLPLPGWARALRPGVTRSRS